MRKDFFPYCEECYELVLIAGIHRLQPKPQSQKREFPMSRTRPSRKVEL